MVRRFDTSRLSKAVKTPSGGVRIDARLTRIGVFEYRRADGSVQKELRLPEEVFSPESLDSLQDAPVTDLHPDVMVSPSNWKQLTIGHLSTAPRRDGPYVSGSLAIQDAAAIENIDSGSRKELSCGYTCKLDMTPGVYGNEKYDAVQREIRYNHIGLGPGSWARGGSELSLKLDGGDGIATVDAITDTENTREDTMKTIVIKLDGVDIEVPELASQLFDKEIAKLASKVTTLETDLGKANGDLATARKDLADASDPVKIQAKVDARASLEASARKVLGAEEKFDGKTEREIAESVVAKAFPEIALVGKSDDYVAGLFASATNAVRNDSLAEARKDAEHAQNKKPGNARQEMMERNRKAYLPKENN